MIPLPTLNPLLLSRSKFSPFQLPTSFLASLAGTFRGRWCERGGMIIKTKLQREQSCVCTTLHMLVLEGKQQFSLKAATGLSEGLFHGLHGYWQTFFSSLSECQPLCLFSSLLTAAQGRKKIISLGSCSLVTRWCVLTCSVCLTAAHSNTGSCRDRKGRRLVAGPFFPTCHCAGQLQGWEHSEGPAKQESS